MSAFGKILELLPNEDCSPGKTFWCNGECILCDDEAKINAVADLLDSMGYVAVTGYYDPEEDAPDQIDCCTGYYYVTV